MHGYFWATQTSYYFYFSSILGGSPNKLQGKPLTNPKQTKNSNVLVSDIGIVKRGVSKRDSSSTSSGSGQGSLDGKNGGAEGITSGLLLEDSFEKYYNKDLDLEED